MLPVPSSSMNSLSLSFPDGGQGMITTSRSPPDDEHELTISRASSRNVAMRITELFDFTPDRVLERLSTLLVTIFGFTDLELYKRSVHI